MSPLEVEAKFWLPHFFELRGRVLEQKATLRSPRTLERNLRYDTPDRQLSAKGEVLRLRMAERATLTYKQPGKTYEIRREHELEVNDFETAQELLEDLGYEMIHCYEKYREVYQLDNCLIMLDEVPYGCFCEVEGPDLKQIRACAERLGLHWEQRVQRTYLDMFVALCAMPGKAPAQATFSDFAEHPTLKSELLQLPRGDQAPDVKDPRDDTA
jgi:adenylate cyclase class 2